MFSNTNKLLEEQQLLVEKKAKSIWKSEELKVIKKMGFKLDNLGEWKMSLPSNVGHIIVARVDGKIILTFWSKDKYKEWKPNNIQKVRVRVDDIIANAIKTIDERNNIYHFEITKDNLKEAVLELFKQIKDKFTDLRIDKIPKLTLTQIITQLKTQYNSQSLPIPVKIDLSGLIRPPEEKEIIVQPIETRE